LQVEQVKLQVTQRELFVSKNMFDEHSMHDDPLKNLFLLLSHFRHWVAAKQVKQYEIFVGVQVLFVLNFSFWHVSLKIIFLLKFKCQKRISEFYLNQLNNYLNIFIDLILNKE